MSGKLKIGLSTQIFVAMILGSIVGLMLGKDVVSVKVIGDVWLNLVKMAIVPVVFFVVMAGIVDQKDGKALGRVSFRIVMYYLVTTVIASIIGVVVAMLFEPGVGEAALKLSQGAAKKPEPFTVASFLNRLISSNMFKSFTDANIIQVLIIGILLGVAVLRLPGGQVKTRLVDGILAINAMFMSLVAMVMQVSPIGIFCLMAAAMGNYGFDLLKSIGSLTLTFYVGILLQVIITYCLILWVMYKISPWTFLRRTMALWSFTMATCSSAAAIPVSLGVCKDEFQVDEHISSFTIPLGSQVNHDGNAILFSCVIVFTSQLSGVAITPMSLFQTVLLGTLVSSGGGGIPGSGVVKVFIMLQALGLPTEIGAIVAAFYRIFDMGITTANCLGDVAGTVFVDRLEKSRSGEALTA